MTLIDLSHPIEDGMAAYPGLPPVRISPILDHDASRDRYDGRAEFYLGGAELAVTPEPISMRLPPLP